MKKPEILPTQNTNWGFWGTSVSGGLNPTLAWETASRFLMKEFDLTPEQARTMLDARFGRHLCDDLWNGDPHSADGIEAQMHKRAQDLNWRRSYEKSITEETGKTFPYKEPKTVDEQLTEIAQKHLNIETLETRNSDGLDFHDTAVWGVKAALLAAFEAGKKSRK